MNKITTISLISALAVLVAAGVLALIFWLPNKAVSFEKVRPEEKLEYVDFADWQKWQREQIALFHKKEQEELTLFVVGDIMMSRTVEQKMIQKNDFMYCLEPTRKLVQSADVAIGNLESPIIAGEPVPTGSFSFRADPRSAEALKIAGFDILSLPNNHIGNFGQEGWAKTFEYLKANELEYVGAGKKLDEMVNPLIKEVKGIKMAFLAYGYGPVEYRATGKNAGMAIMDMEQLIQDINEAKEQGADLIIVSMHDGVEYVNDPSEHQRTFARAAIDAGADLVLGHHPHVVQKMELYKEKYIFYSLGNFVFDQMWSQDTREGLGLMIHMNKEGVTEIEYHPVVIDDYCQPNLATGEAAEAIISRLN